MEPYAILAATEEEVEAVHAGLRAYNRNYCPDAEDLSRAVRDEAGRVVAGTDCFRMGTLVLVDVLWVDESCRGQGLGARLLAAAETDGRRRGARRVELNTFGFQAPGFYEKLGYRLIGSVEPSGGDYGHYYYAKELT